MISTCKLLFRSIAIGEDYNPDLVLGNMSFDFMYAGASKATIQVAFDWLSRTLYFGDPGFGWIVAVPGDPARIADDLRRIVVKDLDKPNGIAVDPHSQYVSNQKTREFFPLLTVISIYNIR